MSTAGAASRRTSASRAKDWRRSPRGSPTAARDQRRRDVRAPRHRRPAWMAKGFVGKGNGNGKLNDEDWGLPFAIFVPYSNTISKVDDHIRYGVIDVGYDVWRDARFSVAPFVGYSILISTCRGSAARSSPTRTRTAAAPIPISVFVITEDDTWQALRLGTVADVQIVPGLTLTRRRGLSALRALPRHRRSHPAFAAVTRVGERHRRAARAHAVVRAHRSAEHRRRRPLLDDVDIGRNGRLRRPGTLVPMRYSVEQAACSSRAHYSSWTASR